MRSLVLTALLAWAIVPAGRASAQSTRAATPRATPARPSAPRVLALPSVQQATDHTCGPASLSAVARYFGVQGPTSEHSLAARMGTTRERGSDPGPLANAARALGMRALVREGMSLAELERAVAQGKPVVVLFQAWSTQPAAANYARGYDHGHFAVVIGADAEHVYFEDPGLPSGRGVLPRHEFEQRWHGLDGQRPVSRLGIVLSQQRAPREPVSLGRSAPIP